MLPSAPSRLVPGREANTDLLCIQITDREWIGAPVPFAGDAPDSSPELAAASFSSTPPNNGARHRRRALSKKALAVCRAFRRRYPRPSSRPPLPRSPDGPRPQRRSPTLRFPSPRTSIRPRSRLLAAGAEALSPAELIAVILRAFPGTSDARALELSGRLLAERGGLYGLLRPSPCELDSSTR